MGIIECLENLLLIALAFILLWGLWSFFSSKEKGSRTWDLCRCFSSKENSLRTIDDINQTICVYIVLIAFAEAYLIVNLFGEVGVIFQGEKFDKSRVEFILTTMFAIYALVTNLVYRLEDKREKLEEVSKKEAVGVAS